MVPSLLVLLWLCRSLRALSLSLSVYLAWHDPAARSPCKDRQPQPHNKLRMHGCRYAKPKRHVLIASGDSSPFIMEVAPNDNKVCMNILRATWRSDDLLTGVQP